MSLIKPDKHMDKLPDPPVFLIRDHKFTVPSFYPHNHGETSWIINMVQNNSWQRIKRVAMSNPQYFTTTYFQIADNPVDNHPMFHRRAVLYLTPFGLALYMKKIKMVRKMAEYRCDNDKPLVNANNYCFAANVYEKMPKRSDLLVIYPCCILILREFYESIPYLLNTGWLPLANVILPYRRPFTCISFNYRDIIDFYLAQLKTRVGLYLALFIKELILAYHPNFSVQTFEKMACIYKNVEIEDWVSIPRRLLQYAYYTDLDMKVCSAIIAAISTVQAERFFITPANSCFEISFAERQTPLPLQQDANNSAVRQKRVVLDQDCCVALLLAIFDKAEQLHHIQSRNKTMACLIQVIADLRWTFLFLGLDNESIADYFANLLEKVAITHRSVQLIAEQIYKSIEIGEIPDDLLDELNIPGNLLKSDWRTAIENFLSQNKDKFGKGGGMASNSAAEASRFSGVSAGRNSTSNARQNSGTRAFSNRLSAISLEEDPNEPPDDDDEIIQVIKCESTTPLVKPEDEAEEQREVQEARNSQDRESTYYVEQDFDRRSIRSTRSSEQQMCNSNTVEFCVKIA